MYQRIQIACAVALLATIVVLVSIASIARAVGAPVIWSVEVAQLLFVWVCVLAADIALQQNRHFALTMLLNILPPRRRRIVEAINILILIGLLAFLLRYAWQNALLMHPRRVGATQMPGSYVHASMVLGLVMLLRTMAAQLIARLRGARPTQVEGDL